MGAAIGLASIGIVSLFSPKPAPAPEPAPEIVEKPPASYQTETDESVRTRLLVSARNAQSRGKFGAAAALKYSANYCLTRSGQTDMVRNFGLSPAQDCSNIQIRSLINATLMGETQSHLFRVFNTANRELLIEIEAGRESWVHKI